MAMKNSPLDASVAFSVFDGGDTLAANSSVSIKGTSRMTANVRYIWKSMLHVLSFSTTTNKATNNTATQTADKTSTSIALSSTYEKMLNESTRTFINTGFSYVGTTDKVVTTDTTAMAIPIVAALENRASEHWMFRGSVASTFWGSFSSKNTATGVTTKTAAANSNLTSVNIGASYTNAGFSIDGVVTSGTWFSGANVLNGLFSKLSVSYIF